MNATAELQDQLQTLFTLLDESPDAILALDASGKVLLCNETAARGLDATPSQVIGTIVHDLLPPEVRMQRKLTQTIETKETTPRAMGM